MGRVGLVCSRCAPVAALAAAVAFGAGVFARLDAGFRHLGGGAVSAALCRCACPITAKTNDLILSGSLTSINSDMKKLNCCLVYCNFFT